MQKITVLHCFAVSLMAIFLVGCGSKPLEVKGNITIKGKPVKSGSINFESADSSGSSLGGTIEDGQYTAVGKESSTGGKTYVRITCVCKTGRKIPAGLPEPPGTMVDEIKVFSFGQNNELTCDLQPGQVNEENFDL